ncbi:pyrroline-5-carboxylate reductase, partial [Xanthomonas oryzae pv. oryzae]
AVAALRRSESLSRTRQYIGDGAHRHPGFI